MWISKYLRFYHILFEGYNRQVAFAIGGLAKKSGVIDQEIKIRNYLSMKISISLDPIDGAPAARFINRLKRRIEEFK